jgi:2Fe-2S ferredoxin
MVKLVVTDREGRVVEVEATAGISMMENIRELDASVEAICGGMCACATCHVYIAPEWAHVTGARSYEETIMLEDVGAFDRQRSRLSCQIKITPELEGVSLTVAPEE